MSNFISRLFKTPKPPPAPDMSGFLADYQRMGEQFGLFADQQSQLGAQMMGEMQRQFGLADQQFGLQNQLLGTAYDQLGNQDRSLARQDEMNDLMRSQLGNQQRLFDIADNQMAGQDRMFGVMDQQLGNQGRMFGVMDNQLGIQDQQLGYQQNALGLQDRMLGQMDEQMALGRERFAALNPLSMQLTQGAADAQAQALQQGRDQYDFWTNTYRPVEQRMVDDAMRYNSEAERQRMAQEAGADVEQALAVQRASGMRALERMGVNPNSGRMMQLMSGDGLQAAKLRAGAENMARVAAEEKGFNRLATAAQTGVRLPAQAVAALNASSQAANAGANTLGAADRIANLYTDNAVRMGGLGAQFGSQAVQFGNSAAQFGGNAISAGNSANAFGNSAIAAGNAAGNFAGRAIDANNAAANVARAAQGFGQLGLGYGQEAQGWGDQARGWANTAQNYGQLANQINQTGLQAGSLGNAYYRNQLAGLQNQAGTIDDRAGIVSGQYRDALSAHQARMQNRAGIGRAIGSLVGMVGGPIGSVVGGALGGSLFGRGGGATDAAIRNGAQVHAPGYGYVNALARGGMVRGPGTGTSDDVEAVNEDSGQPIRLSNGEYVVPARTVKAIGLDRLDRIVEETNGKPPVHKAYDKRGQPKPRKKALSR
jgi:hypothetical protein